MCKLFVLGNNHHWIPKLSVILDISWKEWNALWSSLTYFTVYNSQSIIIVALVTNILETWKLFKKNCSAHKMMVKVKATVIHQYCKWSGNFFLEYQYMMSRERRHDKPPPLERLPKVLWPEEKLRSTASCAFGKINFENVEHAGGKKPAKVSHCVLICWNCVGIPNLSKTLIGNLGHQHSIQSLTLKSNYRCRTSIFWKTVIQFSMQVFAILCEKHDDQWLWHFACHDMSFRSWVYLFISMLQYIKGHESI